MQTEPVTSLTLNLFQRGCNSLMRHFLQPLSYEKNKKEQLSKTQLQMHPPMPLSSVRSNQPGQKRKLNHVITMKDR